MKSAIQKISIILLCVFFSIILSAQETVIVNNTSGNLKNNLSGKDLGSIVSLTITGTMDASDFTFMRDSMPSLTTIDMSNTSVTYYKGKEGPMDGTYWEEEYPADKVPPFAFCNIKTYEGKTTLVSVKLPKVRAVLFNAFWGCTNLKTVVFPSTVTTLGDGAFRNCSSLVNMEIPPYIQSLERYVFSGCSNLTSVTLPSTLNAIKDNVFADCTSLRSIHIISLIPQDFIRAMKYYGTPENMFVNIDKEHCILYVPFGTKALYEAAEGWKDFKNIVEDSKGFILSADSLQFSSPGGSNNSIHISANIPWTAVSDQPWLTVSPASGNSDASLTITAEANPNDLTRQASITITAEGSPEGKITIIQKTNEEIINVTPGSLTTLLDAAAKSSITSLTLKGQIDARDFKTMRDEMPQLIDIDLRQTTILEYEGYEGTEEWTSVYYPANVIPTTAFAHFGMDANNTLKSVQIPLNTQVINPEAFEGCLALTSFTIPSSVAFIHERVFYGCTGLKSIIIPSSVIRIGMGTFYGCTSLTTMILPAGITEISESLLQNCSSLTSVQIPSGTTTINNNAFNGCTSLTSINIPSSVTTIGNSAFEGCTALSSISLPQALTFMGQRAFASCGSMTGSLVIPAGIKNIEEYTFFRCSKLTSVEFSTGLDSIKASAFDACFALSGDLTLPPTLQFVGERAFANCRSLNGTLTLPLYLTTIESFAFVDNRSLSTMIVRNPYPVPLISKYAVFEGVDKSIPVQVPYGSKDLYSQSYGWMDFTNITEDSQGMLLSGTTVSFGPEGGSNSSISIKANVAWTATSDQSWLTVSPTSGSNTQTLILTTQANPGMATRTGIITFSASGLQPQYLKVTQSSVPFIVQTTSGNFRSLFTDEQYNSITRLIITGTMSPPDIKALKDMPLLSEVDMSGVTITPFHIYVAKYDTYYPANSFPGYQGGYSMNYSLSNDTSLTSIILPSNLDRIETNAFKGCINLTSVVFPSTLTYMGDYAFQNCTSLKTVQLPQSVVQFGYGSFSGCNHLGTVELSDGITQLPGTFEGCTSLTNVKLPSTLRNLGNNTFKGCTKLAMIEIPPLVNSIGNGSFYGCTSLTMASLPSSVTTIYADAFADCITMSLLILPRSLNTIEDGAFRNCRGLNSIYCYAAVPPQPANGSQGVFFWSIDFYRCILYVPYGTKHLYEQAVQWKEFKNIQEMEDFRLPVSSISMESEQSTATLAVTSGTKWTSTSNQSWLTITPSSGTGSATVTLTAEANPTAAPRNAIVTFNANDLQIQDLTVIQKGIAASIVLTPGTLSTQFTVAELMGMTRLTITGTMDARDFKTIRNYMSSLTELNLRDATINAYTGFDGTVESDQYEPNNVPANGYYYPANGIPQQTFIHGICRLLSTVILPSSLSSIGNYAFSGLTLLDSISIPSSVTSIGEGAFSGCSSLMAIVLPPALIYIPGSLFSNSGLTAVSIPTTVTSIGYMAFGNCQNLTTVHSYVPYPPETEVPYYYESKIFGTDKSKMTLYVRYGAKKYYAAAPNEWKEFTNVVEMPGFRLSAATVAVKAVQGSSAKVGIQSDVQWTATSDQSWLSISPSSGTGADSITFTAQANTMDAGRMATVTISAPDVMPQTIMIIQEGKLRTITLTPGNITSVLTSEEMSGITNLIVKGVMDARDFRIMRDQMPLLTVLDLSQVKIAEFQESDPITGKIFINRINMIPDGAFFDKTIWKGKTSLTQVIFPQTLEKIGIRAFSHAAGLTVLRFPFTMKFIECNAFNSCPYLSSLTSHAITPPESHIGGFPFYNVDKTTCILYVPFGSKDLYAEAWNWKDFQNIVEMAEFKIMTSKATLGASKDFVRMRIQSQVPWTAEPSEEWLTVNPASGDDEQIIIITAEANPTDMLRTGTVIFRATGYLPQVFTITQEGLPKTINLTSGTLASRFTPEEMKEITSLVIIGTMDARDFRVIRDQMPWLSSLDITGATITAYSGSEGTYYGEYNYPANAIPPYALFKGYESKSRLSAVLLPSSLTSIDNWAFEASALTSLIIPPTVTSIGKGAFRESSRLKEIAIPPSVTVLEESVFAECFGLTAVTLPSTLTSIGNYAFQDCDSLKEMMIPSSVVSVGEGVFYGCISLSTVTLPPSITALKESLFQYCSSLTSITIPASVTSVGRFVFFNCSQLTSVTLPSSLTILEEGIFIACSKLSTFIVPPKVTTIESREFVDCTSLVSVSIPESVSYIGTVAFEGCTNLTSLYVYAATPPLLSNMYSVFNEVNYSNCTLYVPYESRLRYASAEQWKNFKNIVEMGGFDLSATELTMEADPAILTIQIITEKAWTAVSDQEWLTVSPLSGKGDQQITFSADTNRMSMDRTAIVTITADTLSRTVRVYQKGVPNAINMTAGTLSTRLTADELLQTTQLILTGEIDARDFKTMRDQMPNLSVLDMSGATIVAYKGNEGTIKNLYTTYPANKIPPEAFYNMYTNVKPKLTSVQLPKITQAIGYDAFNSCSLLKEVKLSYDLIFIDERAFKNCSSLTFMNLVTAYTIGNDAFNGCRSLTTIKLPFGYSYLGEGAFLGCSAVQTLYSYLSEPPSLQNSINPFDGINQSTCILYVAAGTKQKYQMFPHWSEFENIVEMGEPVVSPKEIVLDANVGSSATINISGIGYWNFGWDQSWLDMDKVIGFDDEILTITVDEANTTGKDRICLVTIAPVGYDWQTVVVTQKGTAVGISDIINSNSQAEGIAQNEIATDVAEMAQANPIVTCYPNPFTDQMTIDVANSSFREVNVEIYSISGQKIKTLLRAQKGAKINCTWNGTNEGGQKMPGGMYLLKVNGEVRKVVKR